MGRIFVSSNVRYFVTGFLCVCTLKMMNALYLFIKNARWLCIFMGWNRKSNAIIVEQSDAKDLWKLKLKHYFSLHRRKKCIVPCYVFLYQEVSRWNLKVVRWELECSQFNRLQEVRMKTECVATQCHGNILYNSIEIDYLYCYHYFLCSNVCFSLCCKP